MSRAVSTRSRELSSPIRASTFLRSFLIQGSWNYRTMIGSGMAFALLPALRRLYDEEALRGALARHLEHFNAHPYLAALALGAMLRLETEGADPETVRRLKLAMRGPLGSLGDALVWATVLPGMALGALSLLWLGAPAWIAVLAFLLAFNTVHVGLRIWAFRAGMDAGRDVGRLLSRADLSGWTRRLEPVVAALLGLLVGAVVGGSGGLLDAGILLLTLAATAFLVGLFGGHRTWRPAAGLTVAAIGALTLVGIFS